MSGTLYVVATPIGNLEDITLRALRVLRDVDVIAAEDTRRTARLLSHHGISTATISFHAHNAKSRVPQLLGRLVAGEAVALVSDAGTPGISDPGLELVKVAVDQSVTIDPIPGPSAPLTAVVASGFPMIPFSVLGFPPSRSNARLRWLSDAAAIPHTFSFFEAPHRIQSTMREGAQYFGDRPIMAARELTKMHQEFLRGTAAELVSKVSAPRGEFTIVVGPASISIVENDLNDSDNALTDEFWRLTNIGGMSRRAIVADLAKRSGRKAKDVYAAIERTKLLAEYQK